MNGKNMSKKFFDELYKELAKDSEIEKLVGKIGGCVAQEDAYVYICNIIEGIATKYEGYIKKKEEESSENCVVFDYFFEDKSMLHIHIDIYERFNDSYLEIDISATDENDEYTDTATFSYQVDHIYECAECGEDIDTSETDEYIMRKEYDHNNYDLEEIKKAYGDRILYYIAHKKCYLEKITEELSALYISPQDIREILAFETDYDDRIIYVFVEMDQDYEETEEDLEKKEYTERVLTKQPTFEKSKRYKFFEVIHRGRTAKEIEEEIKEELSSS